MVRQHRVIFSALQTLAAGRGKEISFSVFVYNLPRILPKTSARGLVHMKLQDLHKSEECRKLKMRPSIDEKGDDRVSAKIFSYFASPTGPLYDFGGLK